MNESQKEPKYDTSDEINASYQMKIKQQNIEKWKILKNILCLGFAFMLHFFVFQNSSNLGKHIRRQDELENVSLTTMYVALILSNLFLPVVIIKWLGCKLVMIFSLMCYIPYMIIQFWSSYYTLIPASIIVGLGTAPLYSAKSTYLILMAESYEKISQMDSEMFIIRFFGIFNAMFQLSQVWTNALYLAYDEDEYPFQNSSECGANSMPNLDKPLESMDGITIVNGSLYLAGAVISIIVVALGVNSFQRYEKERKGCGSNTSGLELLTVTLKLLKEKNQLLILVITAFMGFEQAFLRIDFLLLYVNCGIGTRNIHFVMICYGITNSVSSLSTAFLIKRTGRLAVMMMSFFIQVTIIVTLLAWIPDPEYSAVFFILSGLWGICDGIWSVQINALCGIIFPLREEAAFSNYGLWKSVGFFVAYLYSPYLRASTKLYILLSILILGVIGYVIIEMDELKKKRESYLEWSLKNSPISRLGIIFEETKGVDNHSFQQDYI